MDGKVTVTARTLIGWACLGQASVWMLFCSPLFVCCAPIPWPMDAAQDGRLVCGNDTGRGGVRHFVAFGISAG